MKRIKKSRRRGPSREQRRLMKEFRDKCCFEFMGFDRVSADDPQQFIRLWKKNIAWLDDMVNEADRLGQPYIQKYAE